MLVEAATRGRYRLHLHRFLVVSNRARTVAWSARGAVVLGMAAGAIG